MEPLTIFLYALAGGIVRIIIGYLNSNEKFNIKKSSKTILLFLFFGILCAFLLGPESWGIALIAGFGGDEAFNSFYRRRFGKGFGEPLLAGKGIDLPADLNNRQRACMNFMQKYGRITNDQYEKLNRCAHRTASYDLSDLIKRKLLKKYGKGRMTYYIG